MNNLARNEAFGYKAVTKHNFLGIFGIFVQANVSLLFFQRTPPGVYTPHMHADNSVKHRQTDAIETIALIKKTISNFLYISSQNLLINGII